MKIRAKKSGVTLMEMTIVVSIVALLASISIPAIRSFFGSFESRGSAKPLIGAALSAARAIAAREQRYAGIRFQKVYDPENQMKASQYMIFIIHDSENTTLRWRFRAVEGVEPIKLPDSVGVMDMRVNRGGEASFEDEESITADDLNDGNIGNDDSNYGTNRYITDTTSFSVIFSPAGKLVTQKVRIRNREGVTNPGPNNSKDDIFNGTLNILQYNTGMFLEDSDADYGLGSEYSRKNFVIYDRVRFWNMDGLERMAYLNGLELVYINPYTGATIYK